MIRHGDVGDEYDGRQAAAPASVAADGGDAREGAHAAVPLDAVHPTGPPAGMECLDAHQVLDRLEIALLSRRRAEVEDLRLVARWALLHGSDPRDDPGPVDARPRGRDVLVEVGGEGTPRVRDLCLAELAAVRRVHHHSARAAMADVLDLQHRLPRIWAIVESLGAEVWVARKVAAMSRHLGMLEAGIVDAAVAACIAGESPARALSVAEAKVIEADPATHRARAEAQRRRRFVSLSTTDEHGLRHLIARLATGDAAYLDAMVDHIAHILATQVPDHTPPDQRPTHDEHRSEALGWLARPAELLQLLLEHQQGTRRSSDDTAVCDETPMSNAEPTGSGRGTPDSQRPAAEPLTGPDDEDPEPVEDPEPGESYVPRALAYPADLLDALARLDPARLRPQATLYLHLTDHTLCDPTSGLARLEDHGPLLATQLADLLTHTHITLKPVIDLNDTVTATSYEHPTPLKERMFLITGGRDVFPHATTRSRRLDHDHVTPYDHHGPPGQTGTHNSATLTRRSHRAKTHAGFRVVQVRPGTYAWATPHHRYYLVGPHGTHHLTPHQGTTLFAATPAERHHLDLLFRAS